MGRLHYQDVAHGFDTIEVNGYGELAEGMEALLDAYQQAAIEERDSRQGKQRRKEVRVETAWELCGQPLMMAPHGVGQGQYQYYIVCPAAIFRVATSNMNDIAVKVRVSSAFLWEHGHRQAWEHITHLLDEWGAFTYQPSEAHLCTDVAGMPLHKLNPHEFTRRGHVVRWHQDDALILDLEPSRKDYDSTTVSIRYGEQKGIAFSPGSPHTVVLYNKPREIRYHSPDKTWFGDIWKQNGWDGESPIVRIEIRYKREFLHDHGIETMEDLFDRLDELWAYSTRLWLRHVRPTKDKQRSRWPSTAWWQTVQGVVFERQDAAPAERQHVRAF